MATTVLAGVLQGIDAIPIRVEVDLLRRLPRICIVGLAANAVKESAERVRSALVASGVEFPRKRVVINLAPADVRKEGTGLDLPMALGILAADGAFPEEALAGLVIAGELGLGGELRPIRGALALAQLARSQGKGILLPESSAALAALVPDVRVHAAPDLAAALAFLRGERTLDARPAPLAPSLATVVDLAEVRGQGVARRALELAAAGAHHLLMLGPPGCGKSMLAQRLPTILPTPTFEESLQITRIHNAAGLLGDDPRLLGARPFRAPHHSITVAGLVGDRTLRPGEVSLAHHGVLFLDEAPEFQRSVLEVLRAPLEDGVIRLSRAAGTITYPAGCTLVLASNPCPCGNRGGTAPCRCGDGDVFRYLRRLSGPLLDRVDLHVELEPVPPHELLRGSPAESSSAVRVRVERARQRQRDRGQEAPNGQLRGAAIEQCARPTREAEAVLEAAVLRCGLSGRATTRVLKVALTIADLAGDPRVDVPHVQEALQFRPVGGLQ